MRPLPKEVFDDTERIFGYRLSRTRRTIENFFGICSSRFRVLRKLIIRDAMNLLSITKAVVSLHNCLINETDYISRNTAKNEKILNGKLHFLACESFLALAGII